VGQDELLAFVGRRDLLVRIVLVLLPWVPKKTYGLRAAQRNVQRVEVAIRLPALILEDHNISSLEELEPLVKRYRLTASEHISDRLVAVPVLHEVLLNHLHSLDWHNFEHFLSSFVADHHQVGQG